MKKRIYFAHPFKMRYSMSEHEIITLLEEADYEVIEPFEDEQVVLHKYGLKNYYDDPRKDVAQAIYNRDYNHVKSCDEIFAWFPEDIPCIGTAIELAWADFDGKYTYVLSPIKHPFLLTMADFIYTSWEQLRKEFKEDAKFGG